MPPGLEHVKDKDFKGKLGKGKERAAGRGKDASDGAGSGPGQGKGKGLETAPGQQARQEIDSLIVDTLSDRLDRRLPPGLTGERDLSDKQPADRGRGRPESAGGRGTAAPAAPAAVPARGRRAAPDQAPAQPRRPAAGRGAGGARRLEGEARDRAPPSPAPSVLDVLRGNQQTRPGAAPAPAPRSSITNLLYRR